MVPGWDSESELHYYRARYNDPKVGRFISEDPLGFTDGVTFYAYVGNNPVNLVDPRGLWAAGIGGGVGWSVPGLIGDANCIAVTDDDGNTGVLCCAGAGPALSASAGLEAQLAGGVCFNCDTICDMPGRYVQLMAGAAGGAGGNASAGATTSTTSSLALGSIGLTGGVGGYGGVTGGSCWLAQSSVNCDECR